jgi:hypothetical protein
MKTIGKHKVDNFTYGYLVCALWASTTGKDSEPMDENHSLADLAPETIEQAIADCKAFEASCTDDDLNHASGGTETNGEHYTADERNGHDLWLTRNGHGAGFWDRGYPKDVGERLSKAAEAMGSRDLHIGDDDKIHSM